MGYARWGIAEAPEAAICGSLTHESGLVGRFVLARRRPWSRAANIWPRPIVTATAETSAGRGRG
jgi:hypothetical protein